MKPEKPDPRTSARMAGIRRLGTKAEAEVGSTLHALGLRYRKNVRVLPGSPDFANRRARWAVFVNGCYWHHHRGCRRATVPKANREFWLKKFIANRRRDAKAVRELRRSGFRVVIIWECQTGRTSDRLAQILEPRRVGGRQSRDH